MSGILTNTMALQQSLFWPVHMISLLKNESLKTNVNGKHFYYVELHTATSLDIFSIHTLFSIVSPIKHEYWTYILSVPLEQG